MHFGDKEHEHSNYLFGIFYTSMEPAVKDGKIITVMKLHLESIKECKYFNPAIINTLTKDCELLIDLDFIKKLEPEKWYVILLKEVDTDTDGFLHDIEILEHRDVSESSNSFDRLH